jgi:hypothetical protein
MFLIINALNRELNFTLRSFNKVSRVTIPFRCQFCILKIYNYFYRFLSSLEKLRFELPPQLRCMKILREFIEIIIFGNAMVRRGCLN